MKIRKIKKILAASLSVMMLFSVLPTAVYAADTDNPEDLATDVTPAGEETKEEKTHEHDFETNAPVLSEDGTKLIYTCAVEGCEATYEEDYVPDTPTVTEETDPQNAGITNEAALKAAVNTGGTVTLEGDITLSSALEIPQNVTVTIDLATYTLSASVSGYAITNKGDLTITGNGTITTDSRVISNEGTLTVKSGNLISTKNIAICNSDNSETNIEGGMISSVEGAVIFPCKNSIVNISGGILSASDNAVVAGNGTKGWIGNTVTMTGGVLEGSITSTGYVACGIYFPNDGTLTISGGEINVTGGVGVLARAGVVNIGGEVKITTNGSTTGKVGDSRVVVPCSAVVFDTDAGYPGKNDESKIAITGGTFTSAEDEGTVYQVNDKKAETIIEVSGGTFTNPIPEAYCAENFIPAESEDENGNKVYGVKEANYVASIAGTDGTIQKYESMSAAYVAAEDGDIITLLKDTDWVEPESNLSSGGYSIGKNVTIDLYGYTLNLERENSSLGFYLYLNKADKKLTIQDTSASSSGILTTPHSSYIVRLYGGDFELESGTLKTDTASRTVYVDKAGSTFTMNGGRLVNSMAYAKQDGTRHVLGINSGSAIINAGLIQATNAEDPMPGVKLSNKSASLVVNDGNFSTGTMRAIWKYAAGNLEINGGTFEGTTGPSVYITEAGTTTIGSDDKTEFVLPELALGTKGVVEVKDNVTVQKVTAIPSSTSGNTDYTFQSANKFGGRYGTDFTSNIIGNALYCEKQESATYFKVAAIQDESDDRIVAVITNSVDNTNKLYGAMDAAMSALKNGDKLTLKKDVTNNSTDVWKSTATNVTIDLNGHNVTSPDTSYGCLYFHPDNKNVASDDTIRIEGSGKIQGKKYAVYCDTSGSSSAYNLYTLSIGGDVSLEKTSEEEGAYPIYLNSQQTRLYLEAAQNNDSYDYTKVTNAAAKTTIEGKTYVYYSPTRALNEQKNEGGVDSLLSDSTFRSSGNINVVTNAYAATLDLGGHTLTYNGAQGLMCNGVNLTVQNGTIANIYQNACNVVGTTTAKDETLSGKNDSVLMLKGVTLQASSSEATGLTVNGSLTGVKVTMEDCAINCDSSENSVGVYFPVNGGTLTITNTKITAANAVQIKGGTVTIDGNSEITSTGPKVDPAAASSGCTNTGDAVYVEDTYGYNPTVTIKSGTITSKNGSALNYFKNNQDNATGKIKVSGGAFSSEVAKEYCAEGYYPVTADGSYSVSDTIKTNVEPVVGKTEAKTDASISDESTKTAINEALSNVSITGLESVAGTEAERVDEKTITTAAEQLKKELKVEDTKNVNIFVEVYLDITAKEYSAGSDEAIGSYTVDITPKQRVIATTADSHDNVVLGTSDGDTQNAVVLEESEQEANLDGISVEVVLPLPEGFNLNNAEKVLVRHTKDAGTDTAHSYYYSGNIIGQDGSKSVTFTNPHGFSEFTILDGLGENDKVIMIYQEDETPVTQKYSSVTEAIAAMGTVKEATIQLVKDSNEDVVIPADKTIELDLNGKTLTNSSSHTIDNKGTLTITDTSTGSTGTVDNVTHAKAAVYNEERATCTILAGQFTRSLENGQNGDDNGGNSFYTINNYGTMKFGDENASDNDRIVVTANGHYSSLVHNGWQSSTEAQGKSASMTIYGGMFTGGINTIKNDESGHIIIKGGTFTNVTQYALQNWNVAEIHGGTFESNTMAAVYNGAETQGTSDGKLTITDGSFKAPENYYVVYNDNKKGASTEITGGTYSSRYYTNNNSALQYTAEANSEDDAGTYKVVLCNEKNAAASIIRSGSDGIAYYPSVRNAVNDAAAGDTVKLLQNVALGTAVVIAGKDNLTLDLNGYSITRAAGNTTNYLIGVVTGEKLVVQDTSDQQLGMIENTEFTSDSDDYKCYGILTNGTVEIQSGNIHGDDIGIRVSGSAAKATIAGGKVTSQNVAIAVGNYSGEGQATVDIIGGTVSGVVTGVEIAGNTKALDEGQSLDDKAAYSAVVNISENAKVECTGKYGVDDCPYACCAVSLWGKGAKLNVNGGTIKGTDYGISGNGRYDSGANYSGTEINISGGKVQADSTCIYHPQYGELTISGGSVTGATGVEIRAGKMTVSKTASIASDATEFETKPSGNGNTTSGAGIAVVQHTTKLPIDVTIIGGTITGRRALYEDNLQNNPPEDIAKVSIRISNGSFTSTEKDAPAVYSADCIEFVSGGNFSSILDAEYCANGYVPTTEAVNGMYTVTTGPKLYACTLTLDGTIGVNYYVNMTGVEKRENYGMQFEVNGKTTVVPYDANAHRTFGETQYYRFTCPVAAKQMTDMITAQIVSGENNTPVSKEYTYSVKTYCDRMMNGNDEKLTALLKAMLNYGGYAQQQFNYNTDRLANAELFGEEENPVKDVTLAQLEAYKGTITGVKPNGITKISATLTLDSTTTIRFYIYGSVAGYTFSVNGDTYEPIKKEGNDEEYYIEVPDITVRQLDDMYTLSISDSSQTYTFSYGALTYAYNTLNTNSGENLQNVVKAMYLYYDTADKYDGWLKN